MERQTFVLATDSIVEILPALHPVRVPGLPPELPGVVNYHGTPVPVLDVGLLAFGMPVRRSLRTRIVLVSYPREVGGGARLLGLLLEQVGDLVRREPSRFHAEPTRSAAPFAGPFTTDDRGELIQRVELRDLVSDDLWARLADPSDAEPDRATD